MGYLLVEVLSAAGAALSFIAAYWFWVEIQTRPAQPTSFMPLYLPAIGCGAFVWALVEAFGRKPAGSREVMCPFVIGLIASALALLWPQTWR
jgi:hypothetical protein